MKYNFQAKAKMAGMTALEIGVVGTSMLLSQKFLSFDELFKDKIAADPTYKDKWFIKHQGAIKFAVGVLAAVHIPNPWLRLVAFGVAANGLVQEIRVLTTKEDGTERFEKIGETDFDKRLRQAAESVRGPLSQKYPTQVAGPLGTEYLTQVARPIDLMNDNYSSVGYVMERGMGVAMMVR